MRVSEIYLSIQGEGPRVGLRTVFVRFGGCNLRCPGWPCDTQHAIDPRYREEWKAQTPKEVLDQIVKIGRGANICLTGGEPFLQPKAEMDELISLLLDNDLGVIECFSNGMLPYTLLSLNVVKFVMDWKLPGSGEYVPIHPVRNDNFKRLWFGSAVKFTIASREDYEVAKDIYLDMQDHNLKVSWYYGTVWGKLSDQELVQWVLDDKLDWIHTMQVHNYIWDRTQRGI